MSWIFTPVIRLCDIPQLTLREGDYPSEPELIIATFEKSRVFSSWWQKRKEEFQSLRSIQCAFDRVKGASKNRGGSQRTASNPIATQN